MPYKPTGKPPGRPRKDGLPAATKGAMMAKDDETKPEPAAAAPAAEPKSEATAPATPLVMTQEQLNQIIAAATSAARTEVMGDMVKLLAGQKAEGASDTSAVISDLAMAIAGMTDTGAGRRVIPPLEAKKREDAALRMGDMLNKIAADTKLLPHYKIVSPTWLDGQLLEAQVPDGDTRWKYNEVIWRGCPNAAMRPINAIAKELYAVYLESIGGTTKNQSGVREHPTWVGNGGLQIMGQGSATAQARGLVIDPVEPATLGADLPSSLELTSTDDLNATKIPILGKTFAPAERTAPGAVPKLSWPHSS